jgi:hypothetical protein
MSSVAHATFIVEADNVAPEGKAFDHFVSTPAVNGFQLSATPSIALGLVGNQSAFGNPDNATGPDRYTLSYTPGVDVDNTTFAAGTVLGNSSALDLDGAGPNLPSYTNTSQLATGLMGGASGLYNVYFTVPATTNVNPLGSTITINNNGSPVVLNPVVMNNGGTGPDEVAGGTYTGGANNRWLKIGTVPLISGSTYSVVIEANAMPPDAVSQRTHGVMWEYAGPLPNPGTNLITFDLDPVGNKPNGFTSAQSSLVTFTDTVGNDLEVADFTPQSIGNGLEVGTDGDASSLEMNFATLVSSLSLDFGNDDPSFTSPGDLGVLKTYVGATLVGQTSVVLNRNDLSDQTISIAGVPFNRATFAYTNPSGSPTTMGAFTGLIEIVDNIRFTPVPEPTSLVLLATAIGISFVGRRSERVRSL